MSLAFPSLWDDEKYIAVFHKACGICQMVLEALVDDVTHTLATQACFQGRSHHMFYEAPSTLRLSSLPWPMIRTRRQWGFLTPEVAEREATGKQPF